MTQLYLLDELTHANKVKDNAPALGRATRRVRPQRTSIAEEDEPVVEAQGAPGVKFFCSCALLLREQTEEEDPYGRRSEERYDVQLI